jgi:hypothetical protein
VVGDQLVNVRPAMLIEQRKNRRFDLRLPVEIVFARTNQKFTGQTRNVSSSGVLFTSERRFEIGEPINYILLFPKARRSREQVSLRCSGKVIRNEGGSTFAATLEHPKFLRRLPTRRATLQKGSLSSQS